MNPPKLKHGLQLAPFGYFSDPNRLIELAMLAEDHGWDGIYLWDHVRRNETDAIADPWVALAAIATVTSSIRIGPLITPIVRRRPIKLATEVVTLDRLSGGRVTLGLGLGVDTSGELSRFGEVVDPRQRGAMLDEGANLVSELLTGRLVEHDGEHFRVDGARLERSPHQTPRPPIWMAARGDALKPVRRAARFEGIFPIEVNHDRLARIVDTIIAERGNLDGFDVCVQALPDGSAPPFAVLGATWLLQSFPAVADPDEVAARVAAGPPE